MDEANKWKIEKFSGQNFGLWKVQIESLLIKQDLQPALLGKTKGKGSLSDEEWEKLDLKARATIFLALSSNVLFNVSTEKTTKELVEKLSSLYEIPSASNKVFIMKKLYNLKMKEGGVMLNHLNEFNTLASQLISVGIPLDDEIKAILLLRSLPNSWEGVVMAVSTSIAAKNKLKFDEVAATLLSEDMRRKHHESSSSDALTVVSTDNRGRSHERGRNNNNNGRGRSNHHSKSRGRNGTCWFCGKPGHTKKQCWNYKKAQNKVIQDGVNAATDGALVLAAGDMDSSSWVLDSGTSFHATPCRSAFTNYHEGMFGKVFLGDNKECDIISKGDILLSIK